jgi:hypothetical protein
MDHKPNKRTKTTKFLEKKKITVTLGEKECLGTKIQTTKNRNKKKKTLMH